MLMCPNPVVSCRKAHDGTAFYDRGRIFMVQPGASPVPSIVDTQAPQIKQSADLTLQYLFLIPLEKAEKLVRKSMPSAFLSDIGSSQCKGHGFSRFTCAEDSSLNLCFVFKY